jgi:ankyrin repeat protein
VADKREQNEKYDEIAKLLIEKGADVNVKTSLVIDGPSKETPLHRAVAWGHVKIVSLLIRNGADVNAGTDDDRTPLDYVIDDRNGAAIRELLRDAGAKAGKSQ